MRRWADLQELKEVEASQIVREGREGQRRPPHWHFTPFREGPSSVRGGLPCQGKAGQEESGKWKRDRKSSVSGTYNLVFVCILNIAMGDTSHKRSLDFVLQYYTPTLRALKYA